MILSRYRYRPVTVTPLPWSNVTERYGPLLNVTNVTNVTKRYQRYRTLPNVTERYQRYQRYQRYIYFLTTEYKIPSNKVYVTLVTLVTLVTFSNVR